jgi:cytochrome c
MNSFELNKILGAVLGTCLLVLSINIAAGAIFAPAKPAKPGYVIAVPEEAPSGPAQPAEPQQSIEQLLASAEVGRGESAAKKCAACHTFNKGGRNLVGPNLWDVVGRAKASEPGFNYSAALKAKGGNWTIEDLNKFIQNPKGDTPGTNMSFAGVPRGSERADLIAFLNSLSDNPKPLPKAAEAPGAPRAQ